MKCSKLRRLIADGGPAALAGIQEAEDHLVDCAECLAVLEAMTEIDLLLPALEGHDAADEVVEQLLSRSELREPSEEPKTIPIGSAAKLKAAIAALASALTDLEPARRLGSFFDRARQMRLRWGIVAVPAVLLIGVVSVLTMRSFDAPELSSAPNVVKLTKIKDASGDLAEPAILDEMEELEEPSSRVSGSGGALGTGQAVDDDSLRAPVKNRIDSGKPTRTAPMPDPSSPHPAFAKEGATTVTGALIPHSDVDTPSPVVDMAQVLPSEEVRRNAGVSVKRKADRIESKTQSATENELKALADNARTPSNIPVGDDQAAGRPREEVGQGNKKPNQQADKTERDQNFYRQEETKYEDSETRSLEVVDDARDRSSVSELDTKVGDDALSAARRFLATREKVEDLDFREARGYWANTYVPGDRTLRQLKARLDQVDGASVTGRLHEDARQVSQPFDPPVAAALAVYLHGDRTGVETRERMLVQIGLKATSRRSGMRPAMNVGLVLDLRGQVGPDEAIAIRALLQAFAASSELGDRFSVTVAGRPGGTILPPGDLRHGPLTVAMGELFGGDAAGTALSLEQAIGTALATVRADEDPNAALGSSALVVITSQELGGLTSRLTHIAHRSAVDGVPWSVIGVGEGVDLAELDALVLAGQGNRRLLNTAADADALVDRELAAVSRVVARAVRLRIRLAPGVQLVDVIGSHRLDEHRVQQVRDAEQSIDQRLSRNLGIQTDRGLDEEGIQIIIPSYYAENAHVVLLDVVVPGPGPVADVTVRYKDLVHMKNGVVRAHLEVGRSGSMAGPLERNVLANLVATDVASRLDEAADALAAGDVAGARRVISDALDLVRGIIFLVDGLGQNPDLAADVEMLAGFLDALATLPAGDPAQLQSATDSLRYAGRLKILPPPADDDKD